MLEMVNIGGCYVDSRVSDVIECNGVGDGFTADNPYGKLVLWQDGTMIQIGVTANSSLYWVAVDANEHVVFQAGKNHLVQDIPDKYRVNVISKMGIAMDIIDVTQGGLSGIEDFRAFYGWLFKTLLR